MKHAWQNGSMALRGALVGWRALLAEARHRPWLAGLLARRGVQIWRRFAASLLSAALLFAFGRTPVAQAATITVDGVTCTLHDAITAANTDTAANGCAAGNGADTIELQTDVILDSPLPWITAPLTLEGNGHTIDADDAHPHVLFANETTFTLNEAIITGGHGTGQDMNGVGAGVFNYYGAVTIQNSTITDNHGEISGALFNMGGSMTLTNSTVSGNSGDFGAGIHNQNGTLTLNNSTVTGNTGFSGGGVYNGPLGTARINRSIIAGNTASHEAHEVFESDSESIIHVNNYNVFGFGGDARSTNLVPGATDVVPAGGLSTVLESTLAENNGSTLTHALVSGSAALDRAPSDACVQAPVGDVDQRGFPRNVDSNASPSANECDAGAFEYGSEPSAIGLGLMQVQGAGGGLLAGLGALGLGASTAAYGFWRRLRARESGAALKSG